MAYRLFAVVALAATTMSPAPGQEAPNPPVPGKSSYRDVAVTTITTLVEKGTDRYGSVHAPIWVLNLDIETLNSFPEYDDKVEALQRDYAAGKLSLYSPVVPYGVGHRVIRVSQRPAGCSNLFVDFPMIRAAILHDRLTGEQRFTPAVETYITYYLEHFMDRETGLLEWGVHTSVNVFSEEFSAYDGRLHEIQAILPLWPVLYATQPDIVQPYMERFWALHTDPETGQVDRHHNTGGHGLGFAMTAGELVLVCAYLHTLEPDKPWIDRALKIAHAHWDARSRATDLFPNRAYGEDKRFDRLHSDTTVPGLWASRVLMAGQLTGNAELTDMAQRTLRAWARYGWDEETGLPWAGLLPNGRAIYRKRDYAATTYDKFDPVGHWDLWKDYCYGFETPFAAMMAYVMGAAWLGDGELLAHAKRLANCYRQALPANGAQGTFAANYGQLISVFLALEFLSGDAEYRAAAEQVAQEAVGHLWSGTLLRGFSGRTHYTAIEGAGYLTQALLELDADPKQLAALREEDPFLWNL